MMKFLIYFLLMMAINNISYIYSQTPSTILVSTERVFNFGKIKEMDGKVSHTFILCNRSKSLITIENVATGCSCVSFEYSKEPIKPGDKRQLVVTYNPAYRPGFFSKEIVILSNKRQNYTRLWIKGDVVAYEPGSSAK